MGEVLSPIIWGVPLRPGWWAATVATYGPSRPGGTPQILVDKTSPMTGRLRVYIIKRAEYRQSRVD